MKIRFAIRDLLWLVILAAIAAAWLTDRRQFDQQQAQLQTESFALQRKIREWRPGKYLVLGSARPTRDFFIWNNRAVKITNVLPLDWRVEFDHIAR